MTDPAEAAMGFSEDPPQSKGGVLQGLDELEKAYRESLDGLEEFCPHLQSRDRHERPLDSWREWLSILGESRTAMVEEVMEVFSDIEYRLQVDGKR